MNSLLAKFWIRRVTQPVVSCRKFKLSRKQRIGCTGGGKMGEGAKRWGQQRQRPDQGGAKHRTSFRCLWGGSVGLGERLWLREVMGGSWWQAATLSYPRAKCDLLCDFWKVINLSELQLIFNMKIVSSTHGALMTMKWGNVWKKHTYCPSHNKPSLNDSWILLYYWPCGGSPVGLTVWK